MIFSFVSTLLWIITRNHDKNMYIYRTANELINLRPWMLLCSMDVFLFLTENKTNILNIRASEQKRFHFWVCFHKLCVINSSVTIYTDLCIQFTDSIETNKREEKNLLIDIATEWMSVAVEFFSPTYSHFLSDFVLHYTTHNNNRNEAAEWVQSLIFVCKCENACVKSVWIPMWKQLRSRSYHILFYFPVLFLFQSDDYHQLLIFCHSYHIVGFVLQPTISTLESVTFFRCSLALSLLLSLCVNLKPIDKNEYAKLYKFIVK